MFTIQGKKEENNLNQNGRYKVTRTILEDLEKQVGYDKKEKLKLALCAAMTMNTSRS